jgi:hypothetical protein
VARLLRLLTAFALTGPRAVYRRPISRGGFMLLISLIAVAIGGLIMVSTSPDLSGAAASLKSRELSLNLATLRRSISVRPLFLTTTSFEFAMPDATVRQYATGDYFTTEILEKKLSEMLVKATPQLPFPEVSEGATFLTTIGSDPYVPLRDWYDPVANPSGLFWGASYNVVKNPTFRLGTALEAYVTESLWHFHVRKTADDKTEIWRTDRFGHNPGTVVTFRGANNEDPAISPDGTRIAFQSSRLNGWDIFVVSDDGSLETPITSTQGAIQETHPVWSPSGDRLLFLKTSADGSQQLMVASAAGTTSTTAISVGSLTIYPTYDWSGDGRWVAYAYRNTSMTIPKLALYDMQLKTHVLPPNGNSETVEVASDFKLAFSPNSNDLLYGTPSGTGDASELWIKTNLRLDPLSGGTRKVADSTEGPFHWAEWIPDSVRAASNVTGRWIVYSCSGTRFPNAPYVARQKVPANASDRQIPFLVSKSNPVAPRSVSLSQFGSQMQYLSADLRTLRRSTIDGAQETTVLPFKPLTGPPEVVNLTGTTAFGATRDFWVIPPGNAQLVNSSNRAAFDANAWRAFVGSQADFDGDTRFGAAYLRVSPPARQRHFLIDNGKDCFLVEDDPTLRAKQHNAG